MAFFQCKFHSDCIGMAVSVNVILPQQAASVTQIGLASGTAYPLPPVLYLLHGQSDDESIWMRRTAIERYAADYGIAVVMPNGFRSYYSNLSNGMRFWDYMSQELPELMAGAFRISTRREDTFIAGLSMGGFGALRLGLRCPDRYAAVGAMSAVIDPRWLLAGNVPNQVRTYRDAFGDEPLEGSEFDLFHLADEFVAGGKPLPKFYMTCGRNDGFFAANSHFADHLQRLSVDCQWHPEEGIHSWGFWDTQIQNILRWLPLEKRG